MRIAVFGDIHGHWIDFKESVAELHAKSPLDMVLQCGDAQPIRGENDLEYMHCPEKYRTIGDFSKFSNGIEKFPLPLLFIGGNHEPWNFLDEKSEGGFLTHNIEFLGRVGKRNIDGIDIVGVSGIFSQRFFNEPRPVQPYPISKRRQVTYFNNNDIEKAMKAGRTDILLTHEWPVPLNDDAKDQKSAFHWSTVGSEPLSRLVDRLKPKYIFCGHMHVSARLIIRPLFQFFPNLKKRQFLWLNFNRFTGLGIAPGVRFVLFDIK